MQSERDSTVVFKKKGEVCFLPSDPKYDNTALNK